MLDNNFPLFGEADPYECITMADLPAAFAAADADILVAYCVCGVLENNAADPADWESGEQIGVAYCDHPDFCLDLKPELATEVYTRLDAWLAKYKAAPERPEAD